MRKALVSGFLAFVKDHYGITMTARESEDGEGFVDLYGYDFEETCIDTIVYENRASNYWEDLPTAIYDDDFIPAA